MIRKLHGFLRSSPYFSRDGDRGEWGGRRSECRGAIRHGDGGQKKNFQSRVVDTGQLGLGASKFRFAGKSYPLAPLQDSSNLASIGTNAG